MRKEQEKILNKAKRKKYNEVSITMLSDETWSIDELDCIYVLLTNHQQENLTKDFLQTFLARLCSFDTTKSQIKFFCRIIGYNNIPLIQIMQILKDEKELKDTDSLYCICLWEKFPHFTWKQAKEIDKTGEDCFVSNLHDYLTSQKKSDYTFEECLASIKLHKEAQKYETNLKAGTAWFCIS